MRFDATLSHDEILSNAKPKWSDWGITILFLWNTNACILVSWFPRSLDLWIPMIFLVEVYQKWYEVMSVEVCWVSTWNWENLRDDPEDCLSRILRFDSVMRFFLFSTLISLFVIAFQGIPSDMRTLLLISGEIVKYAVVAELYYITRS